MQVKDVTMNLSFGKLGKSSVSLRSRHCAVECPRCKGKGKDKFAPRRARVKVARMVRAEARMDTMRGAITELMCKDDEQIHCTSTRSRGGRGTGAQY